MQHKKKSLMHSEKSLESAIQMLNV